MIKHTATLAQLNFDDAEVAALVPRFQAFLSFVDKMREVPDDGALAHASTHTCACMHAWVRYTAHRPQSNKRHHPRTTAPGMAPGSLPAVEDVLRADSPAVYANQDGIFANMAQQEDSYLVVPKVGEEDT